MAGKRKDTKKLGELLVEQKLVTQAQLEQALADQKKSGGLLGEILVGWGYTTEEGICEAIMKQYGFPFVQPTLYQPNEKLIELIPKDLASRYSLVGLDRVGQVISVVMSNPLHHEAIEKVEELTHCTVQVFISTYTEIIRSIERHYQVQKPGST